MFRAVQQKRVKRQWRTRVIAAVMFLVIGVPLYFAGTGFMNSEEGREGPFVWACAAWVAASLFWVAFLIVLGRLGQRTQVLKSWEQLTSLHAPYRIDFSDRGLVMEREHARSEYGWPAIVRYGESEKMFLMYPSEGQFLMLPKRCLRGGEIEELRELCRRYLGGESKGFPVEAAVVTREVGVGGGGRG